MANSKITALTDIVTPAVADIIPIVDDVAGTPTTKKATLQEVFDLYKDLTITETNKTLTSPKINEDVALTATATELNALDGQMGAWTSFTPTLTGITLGNGTKSGAYCQIGKTVFFRTSFSFGNTGSAVAATTLTLPVSIDAAYSSVSPIGIVTFYDAGGYIYIGTISSAGVVSVDVAVSTYTAKTPISSTVPMTWADGDALFICGSYEAA